MSLNLVNGWTEPIDYVLKSDGSPANLTDMSVAIEVRSHGVALALSGTTSVVTPSAGLVRFSPAAGDIQVARRPYYIRFRVTNLQGQVAYFPDAFAERWEIRA